MNLTKLRKEIDETDADIIKLIGKRFVLTRSVGKVKKISHQQATDTDRERKVLKMWHELSVTHKIDPALSKLIIRSINDEVVKEHELIAKEGGYHSKH